MKYMSVLIILVWVLTVVVSNKQTNNELGKSSYFQILVNVNDFIKSVKKNLKESLKSYVSDKLVFIKNKIMSYVTYPFAKNTRTGTGSNWFHDSSKHVSNRMKSVDISKLDKTHEWVDNVRKDFDIIYGHFKKSKLHSLFEKILNVMYKLVYYYPVNTEKLGTKFFLYSIDHMYDPELIDMYDAPDKMYAFFRRPYTYLLIHDYLEKFQHSLYLKRMKDALLKYDRNAYVAVVDWSSTANTYNKYFIYMHMGYVSMEVSRVFLKFCLKLLLTGDRLYFWGLGFGAHLAAMTAQRIMQSSPICTPKYMIGMNPPLTYFVENKLGMRPYTSYITVAAFTDLDNSWVPTSNPSFSFAKEHFFVNNYFIQPGCPNLKGRIMPDMLRCSHYRSVELFIESIKTLDHYFYGIRCSSYSDYINGACNRCAGTLSCYGFGFNRHKFFYAGNYYVATQYEAPYYASPVRISLEFSGGFMPPFMPLVIDINFETGTSRVNLMSHYSMGPYTYLQVGAASGAYDRVMNGISLSAKYPGYLAVVLKRFRLTYMDSYFSFTKCVKTYWIGQKIYYPFSKYHNYIPFPWNINDC